MTEAEPVPDVSVPEVSVVVPLYGDHRGRESLAAVAGAWLAQDLPCEVVVGIAGDIPVDLPRVRVVRADPAVRAAGVLRNLAAAQARAPVLCLTDSDVVPLGRDYLRRCLALAEGAALAQPWMYRLPGGATALTRATAGAEPVDVRVTAPPLETCYVTPAPGPPGPPGPSRPALVPYAGERREWQRLGNGALRVTTPMVWPPRAAYDPGLPESMQRQAPFHWGQLLVPASRFAEVGGYCRQYAGWGCEDDDLLVKLASRIPLVRAWRTTAALTCLHLEHPRQYVAGPDCPANQTRYRQRLAAGPAAMIKQDLDALG